MPRAAVSCQFDVESADISATPRTTATGQLCTTCRSISFASLEHLPNDFTTSGFALSQVRSPNCAICQLLQHSLDRSGRKGEQGLLRGTYDGREIQIYLNDKRLDYSIQHCKRPVQAQSDHSIHVSNQFDPGELTRWLEECDQHQCLPQDHSDFRCHLPRSFRVVDVSERRIVQVETFVRYCALSYVWGSRNHNFLLKKSRQALELEGGIDRLEGLPQTILDAMDLCRDIGCRYLWIDSLCIIQDCDEDRQSQIQSMADIYSQSYLCIIAATGNDANYGLRPYGRFGRQPPIEIAITHVNELGGFVATLSPQIAAEAIAKSVWASRGWTLQEQALSRRVLFFAGTYTFFRCERSLWGEDFGFGFSNLFDRIQRWDLPMPPFYRRNSVDGHIYCNTFKQILGEYLRRQKNLRYDEDILNAITGVLTRMKDDIGDHLWGLPSRRFAVALQWRSTGSSGRGERRLGFPSWSWAGWHHDIGDGSFDIYAGADVDSRSQSAIYCWVVEDQSFREVEHIQVHNVSAHFRRVMSKDRGTKTLNGNVDQGLGALSSFVAPPSTTIELLSKWTIPQAAPVSQHLFIWASCATLHFDKVESNGVEWYLSAHPNGDRVGRTEVGQEFSEKAGKSLECFVTTVGVYTMEIRVRLLLLELVHEASLLAPPIYMRIQLLETSITSRLSTGAELLLKPRNSTFDYFRPQTMSPVDILSKLLTPTLIWTKVISLRTAILVAGDTKGPASRFPIDGIYIDIILESQGGASASRRTILGTFCAN